MKSGKTSNLLTILLALNNKPVSVPVGVFADFVELFAVVVTVWHPDNTGNSHWCANCYDLLLTRKRLQVVSWVNDTPKEVSVSINVAYSTVVGRVTLGLIWRNVNIRNSQVKQRAYTSLVRPILEYSSTVWDPYTSTAINKIEAVQRRAARVITS